MDTQYKLIVGTLFIMKSEFLVKILCKNNKN